VPHNVAVSGDLRQELPWLAGQTVLSAKQAAADRLRSDLDRLGYGYRELEGERIVNDESFFDAVGRAFGVEEAFGWDAVVDALTGVADRLGSREAVVWHRADASAFFSLRTVVEAVRALLEAAGRLEPGVRLDVILLGHTRDVPHREGA
jgi:hypothetical protein